MSKRMDVRKAGGWNYLAEDDGEFLGPFPSASAAFKEVLNRGGRVHLNWARTIIGGQAIPRDFSATFEDEYAGRIMVKTDISNSR